MTKESRELFLQKMLELQKDEDYEVTHIKADGLLCEMLIELGYKDIVDAYNGINKWYA